MDFEYYDEVDTYQYLYGDNQDHFILADFFDAKNDVEYINDPGDFWSPPSSEFDMTTLENIHFRYYLTEEDYNNNKEVDAETFAKALGISTADLKKITDDLDVWERFEKDWVDDFEDNYDPDDGPDYDPDWLY